jgi:cation:H+ antiporter
VWLPAVMFLGAGAAIWVAGIHLSDQTDVLAMRLGIGSAVGGVILLVIATNLREIAIVAAAALSGNIGVAVGNVLGGIAIQTVVLVALDAFGVRGSRRCPIGQRRWCWYWRAR